MSSFCFPGQLWELYIIFHLHLEVWWLEFILLHSHSQLIYLYWAKQLDERKPQFLQKSWKTGLVERLRQGIRNWLRNTWHPSAIFLPYRDVDISLASRKPKRSRIGKLSPPYSCIKTSLFFGQKTTISQLAVYTCYTAVVVERVNCYTGTANWAQGIDGKNNCMSKDPATRKEHKLLGQAPSKKSCWRRETVTWTK